LLGHGYVVDTVAQTIIAGNNGLYSLCVQRSRLRQEREALQAEVTNIFHALGDVRQKLVVEMETFASETAAGASMPRTRPLYRPARGVAWSLWSG